MNILISNKIKVNGVDATFRKFVRQNYSIPNPEYITRVRLNKWLGGTPKELKLYEECGDTIILPYGCLQGIYTLLLHAYDLSTISIASDLNTNARADWEGNTIIPRDYQQVAVNQMVFYKYGVLKAPCSSGKTVMGHLIAQKVGMKTLWLTNKKELLEQSKAVGELILGKGDRVGTITDGKVNIGTTITYATVQTMAMLDPKTYKREFNCVIVDEVHNCVGSEDTYRQFSHVLNSIAAEYKYGLSATPETKNGYGKMVFANVGDIKHEVPASVLQENGTIMPVDIVPVNTGWEYPKSSYKANGVVDFDNAVRLMRCDEDRNGLIAELIGDKPTLVLSNNIDHLCYIANSLSPEQASKTCLISTKHDENVLQADIYCKHTDKARASYMEGLRNGELDIMLATYQLAKEGLNIPRLEQVILAFPAVDENIITQSVGRVARTCEGKDRAVCYDLVDSPGYFQKHWRDRKRLYKKNNNQIRGE